MCFCSKRELLYVLRLFNIFWDRQNLLFISIAIDYNQSKIPKRIKYLLFLLVYPKPSTCVY